MSFTLKYFDVKLFLVNNMEVEISPNGTIPTSIHFFYNLNLWIKNRQTFVLHLKFPGQIVNERIKIRKAIRRKNKLTIIIFNIISLIRFSVEQFSDDLLNENDAVDEILLDENNLEIGRLLDNLRDEIKFDESIAIKSAMLLKILEVSELQVTVSVYSKCSQLQMRI